MANPRAFTREILSEGLIRIRIRIWPGRARTLSVKVCTR